MKNFKKENYMNISYNPYLQRPVFKGAILIKGDYYKELLPKEKQEIVRKAGETAIKRAAVPFTIGLDDITRYRMGFFFEKHQNRHEMQAVKHLKQEGIEFEHLVINPDTTTDKEAFIRQG